MHMLYMLLWGVRVYLMGSYSIEIDFSHLAMFRMSFCVNKTSSATSFLAFNCYSIVLNTRNIFNASFAPSSFQCEKCNRLLLTGKFGVQMSSGQPHFHNTPLLTPSSKDLDHILCCYLFVIYIIFCFLTRGRVNFYFGVGKRKRDRQKRI